MEIMFNRLERTIDDIDRQINSRTENRNTENINIQNNRHQEIRTRRTYSITTEEKETTAIELPLPFYI